jgi:hypothetical protein
MSAQVHSLDKLLDFQAALATYTHHAKEALSSIELEIRRTLDWIEQQEKVWHAEVRRAEDDVYKAKQDLARRRLVKIGDRPADTTEQEIALAKATRRLEYVEEKQANCRRWLRALPEAIKEFQGYQVNYQTVLESDVPRMNAFLDRKMDLLEEYMQLKTSDVPPPGDQS